MKTHKLFKGKQLLYFGTCFVILLVFSMAGYSQDYTKSYNATYDVVKGAELAIKNKFGKINCQAWDESRVTISVTVTVDASTEEKAQKVLNKITVELTGNQNRVEGTTSVGSINNGDFSIDYQVRMPRWINLDLNDQFGDIYIDESEGTAKIDLEYGALGAKSFKGSSTAMTIKFSDITVDYVKNGDIHAEYSDCKIGEAEKLQLYSRFDDLKVDYAGNLVLDSQYDDATIKAAVEVISVSRFSDLDFGRIMGQFDFDIEYGQLNVDYIGPKFGSGKIRNSFADASLSFDKTSVIDVNAELEFGEMSYPKSSSMNHQEVNYTTNIYKGKLGSGVATPAPLTIDAKNANVKLNFSE